MTQAREFASYPFGSTAPRSSMTAGRAVEAPTAMSRTQLRTVSSASLSSIDAPGPGAYPFGHIAGVPQQQAGVVGHVGVAANVPRIDFTNIGRRWLDELEAEAQAEYFEGLEQE